MGIDERLLDQRAMSEMVGITTKTAETWRTRGFGPSYIKVGSLVKYRPSDVRAWMDRRTVNSTCQKLPKDAA